MNKDLIHNRFAKNLKNYDSNAKIQKQMAEKLFSMVENKAPDSVLEIGCGTGFLTKIASEGLAWEYYNAIDIVEDCEEYISKINDKILFSACDIEKFLRVCDRKFDLIISNASLQWVNDFEGVVNSLQQMLNPSGELVISTFGKENFREIYNLMGTALKYYSEAELKKFFPTCETLSEIHIMAFKDPKTVLKHLQLTGVNAIENKVWTKSDLKRFENGYKTLCVLRPTLTYNPLYIRITAE